MGGSCPVFIVQGGIILGKMFGVKSHWGNCPGGSFMGVNCPGGNCPGGKLFKGNDLLDKSPWGNFLGGKLSGG